MSVFFLLLHSGEVGVQRDGVRGGGSLVISLRGSSPARAYHLRCIMPAGHGDFNTAKRRGDGMSSTTH